MIDFVDQNETCVQQVRIKVVGLGGAGGNTINSMVESGFGHVEFIAANTDAQALENSRAPVTIQLGTRLTKGLGSGANPEVGKKATEEDLESVSQKLADADIVFLIAGLGGGTGSGGIPVVAQALQEKGILSIAVVTKPFTFEGKRRMRIADETIAKLATVVDTLIVIPNQKLISLADKKLSLIDAFEMINQFTGEFVRSISHIITKPGHINVDFADIQSIMRSMGTAVMGTGTATGENRAEEATRMAISSPLLEEQGIRGARGVLLNITGNATLGLHEVSAAAQMVYEEADEDASIVLGSVIDESFGQNVSVTIIATGFGGQPIRQELQKTVSDTVRVEEPIVVKPAIMELPEVEAQEQSSEQQQTESGLKELLASEDDLDVPAINRKQNVTQDRFPEAQ